MAPERLEDIERQVKELQFHKRNQVYDLGSQCCPSQKAELKMENVCWLY